MTEDITEQRPYEVTIYLRSGQPLVFDVTKLTTKRDSLTNELAGLEWTSPSDTAERRYRRLSYVRLDEIAAIVVV